jgi:hypothetical protein
MNFYSAVDEFRGVLVHLRKPGLHQVFPDLHGRFQGHIETFPTVVGVIRILGERRGIKNFVEQELQISLADKFLSHKSLLIISPHYFTAEHAESAEINYNLNT